MGHDVDYGRVVVPCVFIVAPFPLSGIGDMRRAGHARNIGSFLIKPSKYLF
jgi:hypothetical protein